jgi:hypothetical protein
LTNHTLHVYAEENYIYVKETLSIHGIGPLDIYTITLAQTVRRRIYVHPATTVQAAENTLHITHNEMLSWVLSQEVFPPAYTEFSLRGFTMD